MDATPPNQRASVRFEEEEENEDEEDRRYVEEL